MPEQQHYRIDRLEKEVEALRSENRDIKHKLNNIAMEIQMLATSSEVSELTIRIERLITTGKTLTWVFGFAMTILSFVIAIRELIGRG